MKPAVDNTLRRAKSHEQRGEIDAARNLYQTILQAYPNNKRAKHGLGRLQQFEHRNPAKTPPQDTIRQLVALMNQGQLKTVAEHTKNLSKKFPNSYILWNIFGVANKGLGRLEAAQMGFQKACESNSKFPDAFNNLAVTLNAREKFDEAVANFTRALALKPDYVEAHYNLGVTLLRQNKLDKAVASFARATELKPDYAEAHNDLGVAFQKQGMFDEAVASFTRVLKLSYEHAEVYNNLGVTLLGQGKLDEAVDSFTRALEIKPDSAVVHESLGSSLYEQGKTEAAVASYKRALEIEPNYAMAQFNCARLPTGLVPRDLVARFERFELDEKNQHEKLKHLFFQANILRHKGQIDESFDLLKSANKAVANDAKIRQWQSQCRSASDEISRWIPGKNDNLADGSLKILFILGPSRSGKSTIELTLGKFHGVKVGVEGWRGDSAVEYLRKFSSSVLNAADLENPEARLERLVHFTEAQLHLGGYKLLTCTNPAIISVAHLIYETFNNAYFLFVQRDPHVTASEIYSRHYGSGNYFSYNEKSAFDYAQWYNDLIHVILAKMPQRTTSVKYENFIEDQMLLTPIVENLLRMEFGAGDVPLDPPRRSRSSEYLEHYKRLLEEPA